MTKAFPVDLETDRDELLALLRRNLPGLDHERRFDWLYLRNPAGRARSWFIREQGRGPAVAAASLFPRWMWLDGDVHLCGQVGDFAVDPKYRSLGPAVMLQRATLGPVDTGALSLCYDCPPHASGMAPFRRMGIAPTCRMLRHARLLRIDRLLRGRVRPALAASALARLGNTLLAIDNRRSGPSGLDVAVHPGRFGEEFSRLDAAIGGPGIVRSRRCADELNWRYREDPLHDYVVLTARHAGELVAFAVVLIHRDDVVLIDLFGAVTVAVARQLTRSLAALLRGTAAQTVQALASDRGDVRRVLREARFHYRSPGPSVVAYAVEGSKAQSQMRSSSWSFTHADILA